MNKIDKYCICGGSILALILLFLVMLGVWSMPYRMKKVSENNPLGI